MSVSQKEPPSLKRTVKKIRCAAMVASLAKSWQGWANEHSDKQDAAPAGWTPCSVDQQDTKECRRVFKVAAEPSETSNKDASSIRTISVSKTVQPKISERGGDVVNAIRGKMESVPEESKPFLGNESPTRRRQIRALQGSGGGGVIHDRKLMLQERKLSSRSSSLDTEDSGLGDEVAPGDGVDTKTETTEIKCQKVGGKPKIKIATMGDIKSRWQQWSDQHTEGQKLNPFSEDFDYDYAMSLRLRKGDSGYGRPKEGSKTAERGDRAHKHIHREMEEMVWIIRDMGYQDRHGRTVVTFGRLFDRYVKISDKVVGILLRCRKHKMLDFEGEMLWKGQDDHVVITVRD
ncbi:actin-binding Rho-activating protein [Corythoichthys intestinalis]|uniref:actin-binding Rho-activating protein n=1 Tax=Corythoichthys intestinalis TaxID=161448 RepID=UPI0025A55406|nr:actin-binding Rho-activating protein [Corythoichthys intestinalis]